MADQTEPETTASEEQDAPAKSAGTAKRRPAPTPAPAPAQSSTGPLLIAAAIGLVAGLIGGAAVSALWPSGSSSSGGSGKFSSEQVNDAKKDVCGAVVLARQAVANNMHMKNPDPENPVAQLAVAANARLSLTAGAAYLRGRLEADPATPQDIVDSTQKMAGALERLNLSYLVGQPNTEREQLGHDLDSHITTLGKLCQ
ncbi:hypothetical protein [[Mycobacterium] holstebronense]|uniref:Alanine and proline rich membrane protein n=1 Tax=[Mycobacterium] holstebronense TaxID=3064288 RepID=A0ABM9M343_9MYCO|nr:hypothetical protein [Mycolicibacter sp. MU0102]CAJ1509439.1 hypothetical protein MU0102_003740 [Mycolicibacter sp. MU0102]